MRCIVVADIKCRNNAKVFKRRSYWLYHERSIDPVI